MLVNTQTKATCYHCGEDCNTALMFDDKVFCCEGCKMVYGLLNENDLCAYYDFNKNPGINLKKPVRKEKFAFLDDEKITQRLISFTDGTQTHVTLYLPQMHCSSCLYLLENLHKLDENIISAKVNFPVKEITVIYSRETSLRKVAELLTAVGYEPYLSLNDIGTEKPKLNRGMIYRLGIAGFCFANIMLLSFPEYLGLSADDVSLRGTFRVLNLILSLPVILYSAQPFYTSAYSALRHKFLNIDAPIVLAIFVTLGRSLYEVLSGTGAGYFDSMTGIVFFMLAGRFLQDKTYKKLSFERDYSSYFPIAVTVVAKSGQHKQIALPDIKAGDTLLVHNDELVPADSLVTKGRAWIDYSFVTGESVPVMKEMGELVYAGGKQVGNNIELLTIKDVSQSYLTSLWEKAAKTEDDNSAKGASFVHVLSKYFTYIVLAITLIATLYWFSHDSHKMWNALTTTLIIACPCALLLSNSFTNGNILSILGRNKFFLKNAQAIENIANTDYIVFDKTGTLTYANEQHIEYEGKTLSLGQQKAIAALAGQSNHPLSRAIAKKLGKDAAVQVDSYYEIPGKGISGIINGVEYKLGSAIMVNNHQVENLSSGTVVFIAEANELLGCFVITNEYRKDINRLLTKLAKNHKLAVLTGDNDQEKANLESILGKNSTMLFFQKPGDKLDFIKNLQSNGHKVMMIGDGLNDGPSLLQSNIGIAVADGINNFTPACDAILDAGKLTYLDEFIRLCRANRRIIIASFIISILYNIIGLYFAVQGNLSPLIAAILMPASSFSIMLVTYSGSNVLAKVFRI